MKKSGNFYEKTTISDFKWFRLDLINKFVKTKVWGNKSNICCFSGVRDWMEILIIRIKCYQEAYSRASSKLDSEQIGVLTS